MFQLRPINVETDFPRLAELYSMMDSEPITAETLQEWLRNASAERIQQRTVAVDGNGQIVGFNNAGRDPWMKPGHFRAKAIVDPAWRKRGIGTTLYNNALAFGQAHGATHLESEVRDNSEESLRFAQQRGFSIERHIFESRLYLDSFDESRFAGTVEAAEAAGILFFTLADVENTREVLQQHYTLNRRCVADIPGRADEEFAPFEEFSKFIYGASWYRADGQIIAVDRDQWAGMTAVGYFEKNNTALNAFTGVDRPYRGRKLALALKLLAIRCARKYGARYIFTNNDSENAPMLAVNRNLGYQPQPGNYTLLCAL